MAETRASLYQNGWFWGILLIGITLISIFILATAPASSVSPTFTQTLGLQQYLQRVERFTFCQFQSFGKIPQASCK